MISNLQCSLCGNDVWAAGMRNVWLVCCLVQAETLRRVCLVQVPHTTLTSLLESTFSRWASSQNLPKKLSEGCVMCPWLPSA